MTGEPVQPLDHSHTGRAARDGIPGGRVDRRVLERTDVVRCCWRWCARVMFIVLIAQSAAIAETLDDAWRAARLANQERAAAERETAAAGYSAEAAQRLRWPSARLDTTYTQLDATPAARATLPIGASSAAAFAFPQQERGYASVRSEVSVPLFTSGQIPAAIAAAAASERASQEELKRTDLDLHLQVATAYIRVLLAQKLLDVALSAESSLRAHGTDVARLRDQGIAARNDALAAQVALANAQQSTLDARTQLELARSAYNRLLARSLDAAVELEDLQPPAAAVANLGELTPQALEARPELRALTEQASALRAEAERTLAGARPQIAAVAGYRYEENRYQVHEGLWSIGLGFHWAAFDGGVTRSQAASLREQAHALEDRLLDAQSRVADEVRQRDLERRSALERIDVADKALEQADENLRVTREQYRAGLGNNTNVLDADTLRVRAYVNFYAARYDAVLADWRLRRAVGSLDVR